MSAYDTARSLCEKMKNMTKVARDRIFQQFADILGADPEQHKVFEEKIYLKMIERLWQEKPPSFDEELTAGFVCFDNTWFVGGGV